MNYKLHERCRVCGHEHLTPYLNLGWLPLSNNLCETQDEEPEKYPLEVLLCEECGLSQLSIVVDPEILFGHYVYRSSISQGYKDHCKLMAIDLKNKFGLTDQSFHIDIAGNDGALLREFKDVLNHKVLNVDPAKNLWQICEDKGVRMYNAFWGVDAINHLFNVGYPKADLITATNVFAHVDDVEIFLLCCKQRLAEKGVIVLEFPYLIDFIDKMEFDTVYFEHLSYFSITPLYMLCRKVGLNILSIEHKDIHGGSVRVTIDHEFKHSDDVAAWMLNEVDRGYLAIDKYYSFAAAAKYTIELFAKRLSVLSQMHKIAAFGASAKGNTLLNCAGITDKEIDYIIDETPEKVGKFSPGTGIDIIEMNFAVDKPHYIVLLAWNFKDECMKKCRDAGYRGKFIMPLTFEIIDE